MSVATPPAGSPQGPLPLVIGVVGHRDLREADVPALERAVAQVLHWLRRQYPHTPLLLLSSLAEGADQLVARVGLAQGCGLQVALPFAQELHERDFTTPEARSAFRELLPRARAVTVIPAQAGEAESEPYARLAAYQARHCQLLLALWNGRHNGASGGTGHTVEFALEGIPAHLDPQRQPLAPLETGPVIHLVTARRSDPSTGPSRYDPQRHPILVRRLDDGPDFPPPSEMLARRLLVLQRIEQFNRDAVRQAAGGDALVPPSARPAVEPLVDLFERADALAERLHRRWLMLLRALCVLAGLGVLSLVAFGVHPETRVLLAGYLVAMALAMLLHAAGRVCAHERRYLDYRCLAEGLRVQIFWRLAGLPTDVASSYLRKQSGELEWIRQALRSGCLVCPAGPPVPQAARLALEGWIAHQARYFGSAGRPGRAAQRRAQQVHLQRAAWMLYGLTLVLAVLAWIGWGRDILVVLMALGPAAYTILQMYLDRSCLSDEAAEYAQAGLVFSLAEQRLRELAAWQPADAPPDAEFNRLLLEVGRDALVENGDWLLLHRKKPLEFIPV